MIKIHILPCGSTVVDEALPFSNKSRNPLAFTGILRGKKHKISVPVTAYLIAASPVMTAVPGIIPLIMTGNIVLAVSVHFLMKKGVIAGGRSAGGIKSYIMAVICAALKGGVMGLTISLWLLPTFIPAESPMRAKLPVFQMTFSLFQFITALIGFVYVFIIWAVVHRESSYTK